MEKSYAIQQMENEKQARLFNSEKNVAKGLQRADAFINNRYLDNFNRANIIDDSRLINKIKLDNTIRIFSISKIVINPDEDAIDRITSVFNALYNMGIAVATIICGEGQTIRYYFATRCNGRSGKDGEILKLMLESTFPGISIEMMSSNSNNTESFIDKLLNDRHGTQKTKGVTSLSMIPSLKNESTSDGNKNENFVQGIEKFIDTMSGKKYTAVFLATPLNNAVINDRRHGYESLYSALSSHGRITYSYGLNISDSVNEGLSESLSKSVSNSISDSTGSNKSSSETSTESSGSGDNWGGGASGDGSSISWGYNSSSSTSSSKSYSSGTSFSHTISEGVTKGITQAKNKGEAHTEGSSENITINSENKGVEELLKKIEEHLSRINKWESFGLWNSCCYFLSDDIETSVMAATTYRAIMAGEKSWVENAHINIWNNIEDKISRIVQSVLHLVHPKALAIIDDSQPPIEQEVSPVSIVSSNELSILMGLPRKSVPGVPVIEMAEFGREVRYESSVPSRTIAMGKVYHMGDVQQNISVNFNMDLFSSHCFITGSSGSGKSHATYLLLKEFLNNGIKMLAIEPVKGEYKQIFGNYRNNDGYMNVFTTDGRTYRMLQINPFRFPDNIHVLAHIDQLLQIFNAAWPLYAAMPALLKDSIINAYVRCGWDVESSIWFEGYSDHKYPVFSDVMAMLPKVIDSTDYQGEALGNYKGALLTRVKSMTIGMEGKIFRDTNGLSDDILFDQNTIVDLSDLGSQETISLIMGVLIMRLSEYHKSKRKTNPNMAHDNQFCHVTVLEEAHNLLKRTSKEQSQDGANLMGQSVEMICNSIKEMRTYGEGFLIIDQSPLAVDSTVIENTSTKIVMNLPSKDACEEIGSALSLKEGQVAELSRLDTGVAAVMQKGWLEPVLMKVNDGRDAPDYSASLQVADLTKELQVRSQFALSIVKSCQSGTNIKNIITKQLRQIVDEYYSRYQSGVDGYSRDRRGEFERIINIIESYKGKKLRFHSKDEIQEKYVIGQILLEILQCDGLFELINQNFNEYNIDYSDSETSKASKSKISDILVYKLFKAKKKDEKKNQKVIDSCVTAARRWISMYKSAFESYYFTSCDQAQRYMYDMIMVIMLAKSKINQDSVYYSLYATARYLKEQQ